MGILTLKYAIRNAGPSAQYPGGREQREWRVWSATGHGIALSQRKSQKDQALEKVKSTRHSMLTSNSAHCIHVVANTCLSPDLLLADGQLSVIAIMAQTGSGSSPFEKLPGELKNRIYRYALSGKNIMIDMN